MYDVLIMQRDDMIKEIANLCIEDIKRAHILYKGKIKDFNCDVILAIEKKDSNTVKKFDDAFILFTSNWEKLFEKKVKKLFNEQRKEVVDKMDALDTAAKMMLENKDASDIWVFGKYKWQKEFENEGQILFKSIVAGSGECVSSGIPVVGLTFDMEYPRVIDWIKDYSYKFSFDINQTTEQMLKKTWLEGFNLGESMNKLKDRVNEVFDFSEDYRALRIARTETIRASNFGAEMAYEQSGVVEKKQWLVTRDDRTCERCKPMNGQVVDLGGAFISGDGASVQAPPLHPNCRCAILPVVKKENEL